MFLKAARHFWVHGLTPDGRSAVAGPFGSEGQARDETGDLRGKRLFKLPTSNMQRAKAMIKQARLKGSGNSRNSLNPMRGFRKDKPTEVKDRSTMFDRDEEE